MFKTQIAKARVTNNTTPNNNIKTSNKQRKVLLWENVSSLGTCSTALVPLSDSLVAVRPLLRCPGSSTINHRAATTNQALRVTHAH